MIPLACLWPLCNLIVCTRDCCVRSVDSIGHLLIGITLRVIMQKGPTTPRINDRRLNSRRNQELLDCLKTNKMAAAKPPGPQKRRHAGAVRLHIENRTRTGKNPDDVRTDANKSACASGKFHLDALICACPLEIPESGYKSSQRSCS